MINPFKTMASRQFKNVFIGIILAFIGLVGSVVSYTGGLPMAFLGFSALFDVGIIVTMHQAYVMENRYNLGDKDIQMDVDQAEELDEQMEEMVNDPKKAIKNLSESSDEEIEFEDDF